MLVQKVPRRLRAAAVVSAFAVAVSLLGWSAPTAATAKTSTETTTRTERQRVDSVPTPRLDWYRCYRIYECATVKLPTDYDHPRRGTTELALLRYKARDQKRKLGSLFVNPGGPGGSGVQMAAAAPYFLGPEVLERFDVVGMDPRGISFSDQVRCFPSAREQQPVLEVLRGTWFPDTRAEEAAFARANAALGRACSTTGRPLSTSMSTAQVARDLDVLRRAVGDARLTYLGFSYGSYLGQVYANMFPDRVRAVAIDGVLDPLAWAGTRANQSTPVADRLRSADGATKALREILKRCDAAGGARCAFAPGDPVRNFDLIAERLKRNPLVETDPFTGERFEFGYAELIGLMLGLLYSDDGYAPIVDILSRLIILTEPPESRTSAARATEAKKATALRALSRRLAEIEKQAEPRSRVGLAEFPYDNSLEAFAAVICTDSVDTSDPARMPAYADAADRRAKYFGRLWLYAASMCPERTWPGRDEDAYRGPFNRRTANPVLIVGNYWDPATNYSGAVAASRLLPNSRLLSSDSWGHVAYGTSSCVDSAVHAYLLTRRLPARGKVCVGDTQPFEGEPEPEQRDTLVERGIVVPLQRPGAGG